MRRRAVVIGAGVIGTAVAWNLRAIDRTIDVKLVDTHLPSVGATAYSAGIIRRHHTRASDTRLAAESVAFFRTFGSIVGGQSGYTPRGFLAIVAAEHTDALLANRQISEQFGTPTELLNADDLCRAFPALRVRSGELAVLENDGGFGSPSATRDAFLAAFIRLHGIWMPGTEVTGLDWSSSNIWTVATNVGAIEADDVIVCAGAAASRLLRPIGVGAPVTPRRIGLAILRTDGPTHDLPVCIDDVTGAYFVGRGDGTVAAGVRARPEDSNIIPARPLDISEIEDAVTRTARRVPALAGAAVLGSQAACDGYTPDGRPLLGPVGGSPGLHLAIGFSGGGYKISPAVGRSVAASVLYGKVDPTIVDYAPGRFAVGQPLVSEMPYVHY